MAEFNKLTVIINASGPPAIIIQNPEIMMNVKIPRITQFFHLKVENELTNRILTNSISMLRVCLQVSIT